MTTLEVSWSSELPAGVVEDPTQVYLLGQTHVWTPILPVPSLVTWGRLLIFSELLIPHLKNGDNNTSQG